MSLDEIEDIDEHEARLRRNLESIVADLLTVFRHDIPQWMEREVRNRFVAEAAFAESLDDDAIIRVKKRCTVLGEAIAGEVVESLSGDMDFWFGPQVEIGEGKTFDAHAALIDRLQGAATGARQLLEEFNFPPDGDSGYDLRYVPPAYFVHGKYPPGLAENFWKYLGQLEEVREARRQQDEGRRKAVQRHRWDTVERRLKDKDKD